MPELSVLKTRLQLMRLQLTPLMDALFQGAPEEESERNRRLDELNAVSDSLRIMVRDIQNEQRLLEARRSGLVNMPRDNRWSAAQSIQQRQSDLSSLRKEAEDLAVVVRTLLEKNGFLSPIQAGMKLNELFENFMQAAENIHATSELGVANGPVIMQAHESGSVSSVVPVIVFVYLGIRKLKEKWAGSRSDKRV